MLPKRANDLIEQYAKEQGVPVEDMRLILLGYYREIKHKASELEHWRIQLEGIGWMKIGYKKIKADHIKLKVNKVATRQQSADDRKQQKRLANILKMMTKEWYLQDTTTRKRWQIKKQNKDELERNTGSSMEKQDTDR
jgi:hypothetical protein